MAEVIEIDAMEFSNLSLVEMREGVAALDVSNVTDPEVWENQKKNKIIKGVYAADFDRRLKVEKECMPT